MGKSSILLSIKPNYVEGIFKKIKLFEYRTKIAKRKINKIYIYETFPIMKVVGIAYIDEILEMPPNELWNKTKEYSGIEKKFYDIYFKDKDIAYAYKIKRVRKFSSPKSLSYFSIKSPPQSFVYLN